VVPWSSCLWTDGVRSFRYQIDMYHADPIALQGTDVYLRLPKLVSRGVLCHLRALLMRPKGTNLEGIEV